MTALVSGNGCCSQLHHLPDECAAAVYECDLARLIHNVCSCEPLPGCASRVGCGSTVGCDCETFAGESYESCPEPICERVSSPRDFVVGPPPVSYEPPMPPKILPVPTQSVFSKPNVLSLPSAHATVEVGFGSELTFPGVE